MTHDGWVVYYWISEARAKPHAHPRRRCATRHEARAARDAQTVPYVVRRLDPPVWAPATESAWVKP